jgi:hypothetical protein
VSPDWISAGKDIHVARAVTYFGGYGFDLAMPSATSAVLTLNPAYDPGTAPGKVVVHLPWFMQVTSIRVDGASVAVPVSGRLDLSPDAHRVELQWTKRPLAADAPVSYDDAVTRYKAEYRKRFDHLNQGPSSATSR